MSCTVGVVNGIVPAVNPSLLPTVKVLVIVTTLVVNPTFVTAAPTKFIFVIPVPTKVPEEETPIAPPPPPLPEITTSIDQYQY